MSTTSADIQAAIATVQGNGPSLAESAGQAVASSDADAPDVSDAPKGDDAAPEALAVGEDGDANDAPPADDAVVEKEGEPGGKAPAKTWTALFRAQRQMRDRETKVNAAMDTLQKREAEINSRAQEADAILSEFKANQYEFVSKRGFNYDDWATAHMNKGKPEPTQDLARQLEELKAGQAGREEKLLEQFKAQQAAQEHNTRCETWLAATKTLMDQPEYAAIKAFDAVDEVVTLQAESFNKFRKWLTPVEAADLIKGELEKRLSQAEKAGLLSRGGANKPKQSTTQLPEASGGQDDSRPKTSSAPSRRLSPAMERRADIERMSKQLRWR